MFSLNVLSQTKSTLLVMEQTCMSNHNLYAFYSPFLYHSLPFISFFHLNSVSLFVIFALLFIHTVRQQFESCTIQINDAWERQLVKCNASNVKTRKKNMNYILFICFSHLVLFSSVCDCMRIFLLLLYDTYQSWSLVVQFNVEKWKEWRLLRAADVFEF